MVTVRMGADVFGPEGKLGEISKVVVSPNDNRMTHVVVKHGTFNTSERIIPLDYLAERDEGQLYLEHRETDMEAFESFDDENYRAPDPDYTGPPGFDAHSQGIDNFQLRTFVAMGPLNGISPAAPVFGFPGGETMTSRQRPAGTELPGIDSGTDVFDLSGEKIGEVEQIEIGADGRPTRLVVRSGFIFHNETEIPGDLVGEMSSAGVMLTEDREALQRRSS